MSNSNGEPNVTDTAGGIIVGADPPQPPRQAADYAPGRPDQSVSQPVTVVPQNTPPTPYQFTAEDIERARQQEKDKLYGRIEDMSGQLKSLQEAREAEQAERQRLAEEAEAAARAKEESEMEVRDLVTRKEQEWDQRFRKQQEQYEQDRAVFAQERRLAELENYRRDRLEQEQQWVMPELRDLVTGSSPEEIDASIETMKARTEQIIAAFQESQPLPRGASTSAPIVGPMEQLPQHESLTPDDIRNMDMETYRRYRDQLLAATNPNRQRGR